MEKQPDKQTPEPTAIPQNSSILKSPGEHSVQSQPRSVRVIFLGLVGLVVLAALLTYSFWPSRRKDVRVVETPPTLGGEKKAAEHGEESSIEVNDETAKLMGLKTEVASEGEIEEAISTTGKVLVAANGQAIVGAKVDGRAVRITVEPGQNVKAGQPLVVVDSPQVAELRGQLAEARVRLKLAEQKVARVGRSESRAAVIQAKNRLDYATSNLDRKRRLAALGAAAGSEVAEAELEYKNAQAEYDFQSTIQLAREQQESSSEAEQIRASVTRVTQSLAAFGAQPTGEGGLLTVTAPIAGTVIDRHITVGETVATNKELLTIMNLSNVIVEAQMPETQAGRVHAGQRFVARIPGSSSESFSGTVESVLGAVDPEKRTVAVRGRVNNPGSLLRHELAVQVQIAVGDSKSALLVPASAVVEDEGISVVYVKEGTRYERRPVSIGTINYQFVEVLSGVEAGEQVVTAAAYQLRNMGKGSAEGGDHDDH